VSSRPAFCFRSPWQLAAPLAVPGSMLKNWAPTSVVAVSGTQRLDIHRHDGGLGSFAGPAQQQFLAQQRSHSVRLYERTQSPPGA